MQATFSITAGMTAKQAEDRYGVEEVIDRTSSLICHCRTTVFVSGNFYNYDLTLIECPKCGRLLTHPYLNRKAIEEAQAKEHKKENLLSEIVSRMETEVQRAARKAPKGHRLSHDAVDSIVQDVLKDMEGIELVKAHARVITELFYELDYPSN